MDVLFDLYNQLDIFVIVLLRISGFIFSSPLFGRNEIPSLSKIGISIYLAYILILAGIPIDIALTGIGQFVIVCLLETIKGILLGFLLSIFFSIFVTSGKLIDLQMGFSMGGLLDPEYSVKIPITGNLLNVIAFIIFLKLNGHLQLIYIISESYIVNPIGNIDLLSNISNIITSAFSISYLFAVKIALPIILIVIFCEVVLAIIIKFIPQMNIFVIGIPVKILIGILTLFFIITPLVNVLDTIFESMYNFASQLYL